MNFDDIVVHEIELSQVHKDVKILDDSDLLMSKIQVLKLPLPVKSPLLWFI